MRMKRTLIIPVVAFLSLCQLATAQDMPDTTGLYSERRDTLGGTVKVARRSSNFLSKTKEIRTEVISANGLCKMACCNLAESFENSASVSVGYSDAVTGARQIRLLGQSGIYTQMLDENRPTMRGLSAPFGLNYVPGQWLESIQIAKGVTSVINGVESMTGQINLEHRKPNDERPFYVQASVMNDTKCDLNLVSSLQLDEMDTWSTVIMAHLDGNFKSFDANSDGFMDDPRQLQMSLANRWLYFGDDGVQVRWGASVLQDRRNGGQMEGLAERWAADILNRNVNGFFKVGVPLDPDNTKSVALITDYTWQSMDGGFGNARARSYEAKQQTAFANLLYQNEINERNRFTVGISETLDIFNESFCSKLPSRTVLSDTGLYGEYTWHDEDILSVILGVRGDYYNMDGFKFSPRLTLKYTPVDQLVLRANGGRGLRYGTPLVDNMGVLSTGKVLVGDFLTHNLEESWTYGANATWYLPWDESGKTYLSLDWFGTNFTKQTFVDYGLSAIQFYQMRPYSKSYTNTWQLDFSTEPLSGLTATLTARITDPHQTLLCQSSDIKPMTSLYKAVLNLQYVTRKNTWIFDFTASLNGPCKVWDFMRNLSPIYSNGYTPIYPLLYAQVTRRIKGLDIYLGGENLTNYRQPSPIIDADKALSSHNFDASCVWGPLAGIKVYGGVRFTIDRPHHHDHDHGHDHDHEHHH